MSGPARATARPPAPKAAAAPSGAFAGFGPRALDFLKALAFHQDRAWYEENRGLYDREIKAPLAALLADLSAAFAEEGLPLKGEAKTSIFRLHRDTRFAKDKTPYKTNAGAVLSRDGTKRAQGFLYLHLDPKGCFTAAGFYHPEPDELLAIRRRIAEKPEAFGRVAAALAEGKLALTEVGSLSRLPKGFEAVDDPAIGALVRRTSFIVREDLPDRAIASRTLVDRLLAFATRSEPLLRFGWSALDERERPPV